MTETVPNQVFISDKKLLKYWCSYFGCSANDLQEAIDKIGRCTDEVKLYLSKKPGKKGLAFWWEYMQ